MSDESALERVVFRSDAWLHTRPLNTYTVLDYLALSDFWDRAKPSTVAASPRLVSAEPQPDTVNNNDHLKR
jgi:hypothetical protein